MDAKIYTFDEIRRMVVPLLEKYDMASASVFGVAEDLHRQSGKRVDVYEISELSAGPFRDVVLKEAIAL